MTPESKSLILPVIALTVGIVIAGLIVVWALEQEGLIAPREGTIPGVASDIVEAVRDATSPEAPDDGA
jgi:hypothetical protein